MTARIEEADVRNLVETDPDLSMVPFIRAASLIVDRVIDCATERGYTITDDEAATIEMYVAAHLYSLRDPQYMSKSTERASASFMARDWLAAAKMFDPSGCLDATLTAKTHVGVKWLGKVPSAQIDYEDRD